MRWAIKVYQTPLTKVYLNRHNYNAVIKRKTATVHQQDAQIVCNSTIGFGSIKSIKLNNILVILFMRLILCHTGK